jgi:Ala-tRNA(Pro) deacylase
MAIPQRIRDFLDSQDVQYETLHHSQAFTGQEIAHSLHVSGKKCVKAVAVAGDENTAIAVLPAPRRLNVEGLRAAMQVNRLELLQEAELAGLFPDCEPGAVPAFGNLYGVDVWVDRTVADAEEIVLCAGTHEDCIRMRYSDFAKLAFPRLGRFANWEGAKAA